MEGRKSGYPKFGSVDHSMYDPVRKETINSLVDRSIIVSREARYFRGCRLALARSFRRSVNHCYERAIQKPRRRITTVMNNCSVERSKSYDGSVLCAELEVTPSNFDFQVSRISTEAQSRGATVSGIAVSSMQIRLRDVNITEN